MLHDERKFVRTDYMTLGVPNLCYMLISMVIYATNREKLESAFLL